MSRCIPPLHLEPSADYTLIQHGKIVAGYQVGGVIGVGTYGEVRYAVSLLSGERVAMKIIDLGRFTTETAGLMRKEISILRLLHHPHCIRLIDVHENVPFKGKWCEACACTSFKQQGEGQQQEEEGGHTSAPPPSKPLPLHSGSVCAVCSHTAAEHSSVNYSLSPYPDERHGGPMSEEEEEEEGETRNVMLIVQELAAGGELFSLLSHTGPLPEDVARLFFQQLISGLEHIHSLNIAHRDIKPENLTLSEDFALKICDYGLASLGSKVQLLSDPAQGAHHTATPPADPAEKQVVVEMRHFSGVGSQPYSAPECYYVRELYGGRAYRGAPCDIWSSAVLLFVMLTGRPPFVRPLAKTYGTHLRRCKHFINILNGNGLDMLHPHAKDLLQKLLKLAPSERLTIQEIKQHPFFLGPTPSQEELVKIMEERSMRSWKQSNAEMTHVLSRMRISKELPPSNSTTPHFGPLSPSCSPAFDGHGIYSPSFSASSVPPSPYAAPHSHAHGRAHSPDSRSERRRYLSNASPASFAHSPTHFHSHVPQPPHAHTPTSVTHFSALSPSAHAHSPHIHSYLPPPHRRSSLSQASTPAGHATPPAPAARTLAQSITPTGAPRSVLFPSSALLQVSLQQIDAERSSEIPPPMPETLSSPTQGQSSVSDEQRREWREKEKEEQKTAEESKREQRRIGSRSPVQRSHTLAGYSSHPSYPSGSITPPSPSSPLLSSSFSFPPRHAYDCFTCHLDFETLLELLESRLQKRGCRYHPVHPKHAPHSPSSPRTSPALLSLASRDEEITLRVSTSFQGMPLICLLSIRRGRDGDSADGRKGRMVRADSIKAGDAAAFHAWFQSIAAGLREE